ncbi:MAG: hypothetical protein NZM42_01375 [Gemmatales bacterium]|nr:hypothetical protein [Gemmatales bacterium]MDW8222241.1 hypothetical protein [Gemmatales bacterium]
MPHRLVTCAIIGFWLGTMGYLVVREWHQRGQAPPILAEVVAQASKQPVEWHVFRRNRGPDGNWESPVSVGTVVSYLQRDEANNVTSIVHQLELDVGQIWHHWPLTESAGPLRMESRLEIGLFGEIQRLRIVGGWMAWSRWLLLADLVPRPDHQAILRFMLNLPGGVWRQEYLVPWSNQSLPLNSLGPPDQIPQLRPGQRWTISSLDIVGFSGSPGAATAGLVLPQAVSLTWEGHGYTCLVVQFQRAGLEAEWWVAQDEPVRHWVLQQVVRWSDTELTLVRQSECRRQDLLVPPSWFYRLP